MSVTVLGAGSWGTALAAVFAKNGHRVVLWARRQDVVNEIHTFHTNQRYLSSTTLPVTLTATTDIRKALDGSDVVVFVVPSQSMKRLVGEVSEYLPEQALLAHAVKGFDLPSNQTMSQVIRSVIPDSERRIAVISGPSHAEEVVADLPTTVVVSSDCQQTAEQLQDLLMNPALRVYTNPDVMGTELGGSLKNIIALGVGVADGLGFGDNAKAALMTRGLAEISRLGMAMGASPLTFAGLSGVGDLIVTCTSRHSRNFRAGRLIGQGLSHEAALAEIGMAVEGVPATIAAGQLASIHGVQMPIARALNDILFQGKAPAAAVLDLMGRERAHEIEEVARTDISPKWRL